MIASDGRDIQVGWSDHHIVWIEAAMTLPRSERTDAYRDIAAMTGRTLTAVRCKAYWIGEQRHKEMIRAKARADMAASLARRPMVVAGKLGVSTYAPPTAIKPIPKARLMGCR